MTTPALPQTSDDLENTFLRDNSRKKSYAKALQEDNMQDTPLKLEMEKRKTNYTMIATLKSGVET